MSGIYSAHTQVSDFAGFISLDRINIMLARQYALAFNDFIHLLNAFKKLVEKYTHSVISTSHPKLISNADLAYSGIIYPRHTNI